MLAGFDGVHVGQEDLSPEDAKAVVGDSRIVGVSTHTDEQVRAADASCADYVAIGPVFATGRRRIRPQSSARRRAARAGADEEAAGRDRRNHAGECAQRDRRGADSVAVISGLLAPGESVEQVARDFLSILG